MKHGHVRNVTLAVAALILMWPASGDSVEKLVRPGDQPDKRVKLPNQWYLDPEGSWVPLGLFPMNTRLSPDGQFLAVLHCGAGEHEVVVYDTKASTFVSRIPIANAYYGLRFRPDGSMLYVSGGESEVVYAFHFADGYLSAPEKLRIAPEDQQHVPGGIDVSPDGSLLAVTENWGNAVDLIDLGTKGISRFALDKESRPYDCQFSRDGMRLFVSLWGAAKVAIFNVTDKKLESPAFVETGSHPNELTLTSDGERLFVANANVNTVSVIDTKAVRVVETLSTALYPDAPEGSTPNSVTLSPDGSRLYVANADNNSIAVFDVREMGETRALGFIPVGWYPTSVRLSHDGKTLFVADGKGMASVPNPRGPNPYWPEEERHTAPQHPKLMLPGTLSVIATPDDAQLPALTARVYACSPYRKDKQPVQEAPAGNPIPARLGQASPIKYCIYIIKENRTYDQVLGDMKEGSGDPELCLFPEKWTPNHHAMAREFVLLDNFYVESQVSADGHEWTMGGYVTDFVQKTWPSNYGGHGLSYPAEGAFPISFPASGYLWDKCKQAGVSYRSYGEFIDYDDDLSKPGTTKVATLQGHFDPAYRGFDLNYRDVDRVSEFLKEFNTFLSQGSVPNFIVMRVCSDHTTGTEEGKRTPRSMVADNDFALGTVVDAVSRSPIWKETAIFVVEDDAQNGPDHVDSHRTVALVLSPYTRGRGRDTTFYSTASMLRSMELILGLEPMSQYDAGARPMYNAFENEPDVRPYECRPVAEELRNVLNKKGAWGADLTAKMNLKKEDAIDDIEFNEVIWRSIKGANSPMPAPVRAAFIHPLDNED